MEVKSEKLDQPIKSLGKRHAISYEFVVKHNVSFFHVPEKMLRDVPYTLISDLATYLNPGNRWKDLGGRLHFNNTQISNFALVKKNATQAMLEEWGHRDCATVVALRNIFHSMKWTKEERICAEYV